ncbi:MAG: hypothetical protein QW726_05370 [Fervidicoccaceae archaeon]
MISNDQVLAQNELSAGLIYQMTHVKRLFLIVVPIIVYLSSHSWMYSILGYFIAVLSFMKISPIRIYEKERNIINITIAFIDRKTDILYKRLLKLIRIAMSMSILIIFCSHSGYAITKDDLPPVPSKPPTPPTSYHSDGSSDASKPKVIKEKKTLDNINPSQLLLLIKDKEIKQAIIRQEYKLSFGGYRKLYLKATNYFSFYPSLPILMVFDKDIKNIFMYSGSAQVIYDKNFLFLGPNSFSDAKVLGFAVLFKDGSLAYFAGERVSVIDDTKHLITKGDEIQQSLNTGKENPALLKVHNNKVITYYIYKTPQKINIQDVISAFVKQVQRCPVNGETFTFDGNTYVFYEKNNERILKGENEIFACGTVFELNELQ